MHGCAEELDGFFDDSENIDMPCVILGPGPSLHVDLLHEFDRVLTIGVDETIQIYTPNVWLCTSSAHLHGIAKCLSVMDSMTAEVYYELVSRDWMSCVFEIEDMPMAPVLWRAVWLACKLGAENIHLDGFDLHPDRMGSSFSHELEESHEHLPWDLVENKMALIDIVTFVERVHISTYFDREKVLPVRRIDPNTYWRRRWSETTTPPRTSPIKMRPKINFELEKLFALCET